MSKSIGNVVDPFQAMQDLGTDPVRYYLARVGGRFKDDVGESKCSCTADIFPNSRLLKIGQVNT